MNSVPEGELVTEPRTGRFLYVRTREGRRERRQYPDGSQTWIDLRRRAGTNRTIGHVGPDPARAFHLTASRPLP